MNNNYTGFEKLLKDKLDNFGYPYDNKDWLELEKKLPKAAKPFVSMKNLIRAFVITAAVVIPVMVIMHLSNDNAKKSNTNNVTVNDNLSKSTDNSGIADNNVNDLNSNQNSNNASSIDKSKTTVNNSTENDKMVNDNQPPVTSNNETADNTKDADINKVAPGQNQPKNPINTGYITADVTEGCVPLKVQFTPAIISDTIIYNWTFGDSKTSTKKAPWHTYSKSGSFTVTLTVKFKNSGKIKKIEYANFITVKAKPEARFIYTIDQQTDIYTFTDNSLNAVSWNWSLGDKAISKEENPHHEYILNGPYNVQLVAMSIEGCSDTAVQKITVKNRDPFYLPTGFSPDGTSGKYFGPEGEDMNAEGYKFSIYDKTGKLVFETTSLDEKWDGTMKGANTEAPAGAYVCKITMKNKHGILQDYWPLSITLIR